MIEREQPRVLVIGEAALLVVQQMRQPRQTIGDRKHLVDLFLVLRDDEIDARALEHQRDFVGDGIGIDGHGRRAEHLRRRDRPIEPRPIRSRDRDPVAFGESQPGEALRQRARLVVDLGPGPGPPDAEHLVPKRRPTAAHARMTPQQLGESVVRVLPPRRQANVPSRREGGDLQPRASIQPRENNRQTRAAIALR